MANARFLNPETIAKPFGYTHVVELSGSGEALFEMEAVAVVR